MTESHGQAPAQAAFEAALPALRPEIHRYCSRMAGSVIDGEDILQIALMKAFEALERGEEAGNLRAWLFRIAHNTALDFHRARKRESAMLDNARDAADAYADLPARSEVTDSLRPFLALPVRQRSTVIFRDVFGYTANEVASLTGDSVASVKSALHRGRAKLRQAGDAPRAEPAPLSDEERRRLHLYARHFNEREFDRLRDMLSEEVRLELVSRVKQQGKHHVGNYYGNYARAQDWRMAPGRVEGRPAMLAFDPADKAAGPAYFILLTFADGTLRHIRDFRYARYAIADAEWERLG